MSDDSKNNNPNFAFLPRFISNNIPEYQGREEIYKALGIEVLGPAEDDPHSLHVRMPEGWKIRQLERTEDGIDYLALLDDKWRVRAQIEDTTGYVGNSIQMRALGRKTLSLCKRFNWGFETQELGLRCKLSFFFNDAAMHENFKIAEFETISAIEIHEGKESIVDRDYLEKHKAVYERLRRFRMGLGKSIQAVIQEILPDTGRSLAYWDDDLSSEIEEIKNRLASLAAKVKSEQAELIANLVPGAP